MADWLLIRLAHGPETSASWVVIDARGVPSGIAQSGPLMLAAPRTAGRRVGVLVTGAGGSILSWPFLSRTPPTSR